MEFDFCFRFFNIFHPKIYELAFFMERNWVRLFFPVSSNIVSMASIDKWVLFSYRANHYLQLPILQLPKLTFSSYLSMWHINLTAHLPLKCRFTIVCSYTQSSAQLLTQKQLKQEYFILLLWSHLPRNFLLHNNIL